MTYEEIVASLLLKKDKHIEELNSALKKGQTEHIIEPWHVISNNVFCDMYTLRRASAASI